MFALINNCALVGCFLAENDASIQKLVDLHLGNLFLDLDPSVVIKYYQGANNNYQYANEFVLSNPFFSIGKPT
jgi:hypothetical protein